MSPLDPQESAAPVTAVNTVTEAGRMAPKEYDAVLLASFGGPEGQEDVIPFLRNVTRGRGIPDERLEEVSHHCLLYTSPSPRDISGSRMPSSA